MDGQTSLRHIDVLGAEQCYGSHATRQPPRQAVLRVAVTHSHKAPLELFAKEIAAAGKSWARGSTGIGGCRPAATLSIRQFPLLVPKCHFLPRVEMEGKQWTVPADAFGEADAGQQGTLEPAGSAPSSEPVAQAGDEWLDVPLIRLAYGRSGDKGDISNIGIMARHPSLLPTLRAQLTEMQVGAFLSHLVKGVVTRYDLPGSMR